MVFYSEPCHEPNSSCQSSLISTNVLNKNTKKSKKSILRKNKNQSSRKTKMKNQSKRIKGGKKKDGITNQIFNAILDYFM